MKAPVESSTISRSQSETVNNGLRKNLILGTTTKLDTFFPLFDQMSQNSYLPKFIYYLCALYLYFQVFFTSFWSFNHYWSDISNTPKNVFFYFQEISWFFNVEMDIAFSGVAVLIVYVICLAIFLFEVILLKNTSRLIKWTLFPLRLVIDIISPVMVHPCAAILGCSIKKLVVTGDLFNWVYICFGIVMYSSFLLWNYIGFSILTHSAVLSLTPFATFDQRLISILPIFSSLYVFFSFIFSLFDNWAMVIVQLSHIIIAVALFYPAIYLPFHAKSGNIIFFSVICGSLINDLIFTALHFIPNVNHTIGLVTPFAVLVLMFIVFTLVVIFYTKAIVRSLDTIGSLKDCSDESKYEIISSNKYMLSEEKVLMAMHIGFTNALECFYDWTLARYITTQFSTAKIFISIIQYLCFFPGESRQLNAFFTNLVQRRDLTLSQRFLVYQVYKVKTIRQSSVSSDANGRLAELKGASNQCFEDVLSFWTHKSSNVAYLEMIADENKKTHAKWEESIRDFPNNPKFCDEYCSFLIDCESNLLSSVAMKHRSELIEMGRTFSIDVPFRSLIRCFPIYVKKKIVDLSGNVKEAQRQPGSRRGSESNGSNNNSISYSTTFTVDAEIEETLGRQLFKQSNIRLGMHRALANRKSYASTLMLIAGTIAMVCGFAAFIALYIFVDGYASNRTNSLTYLGQAGNVRFNIDLSTIGAVLKYAYFSNKFTTLDLFNSLEEIDTKEKVNADNIFLKVDDQISYNIHEHSINSRNYFSKLLDSLASLSEGGENIYEIAKSMMVNEVPFFSCYNGAPCSPVKSSIKAQQSYLFFVIDRVAYNQVNANWYNSNEICELISNLNSFALYTFNLFSSLRDHQISLCETKDKIFKILMIAIPIALFLIDLIPLCIFTQLFLRDANALVKIMLELDPPVKEEARLPIRRDNDIELMSQMSEKKPKGRIWSILTALLVLFSLAAAIICFLILWDAFTTNQEIKRLAQWHLLSVSRLSYSVECLHYLIESVILNSSISTSITNRSSMVKNAQDTMAKLGEVNDILLKGSIDVEPCYGIDDKLDEINFYAACNVPSNNTELHDTYRCASASQGLGIFLNMISTVIKEIDQTKGNLGHVMIPHSLHLVNRHLLNRLQAASDRLEDLSIDTCNHLRVNSLIILIFGILVSIIIFVLSIIFYRQSTKVYGVGLALAQRIPPTAFISKKSLLNFVLNRKNDTQQEGMSTSQSAIHMSLDAIFCCGSNGVIEIVNPAVSHMLGYTPDQLLGQPTSSFFAEKDAEKVSAQLGLMKNGQSALVYEDHLTCVTDSSQSMPCGVTILGMVSGSGSDRLESFVVILRDETQLMKQQREAEQAKTTSENLLFQILPRDIVVRLNRGEKDISFSVPSASIIFTDVVRFSEYAASLSPQEIMGNLSTLFAAFDGSAKKYPLLTKIKLIGDIYMAAAGLFASSSTSNNCNNNGNNRSNAEVTTVSNRNNGEVSVVNNRNNGDLNGGDGLRQDKAHAEQILRFALDCLTELDEVNLKLNANLQLRVGINSGGPLLAGVLGTDKPVFDIIGDPINVAARLQTTDVPGKIQIPQATYDLVRDGEFFIEQRGEVFLKGKGKTMSYLVSPSPLNNLTSMDMMSMSKEA